MIGKIFGLIWKGVKGFVLFWVDFIIGDSPEIAIGVVIILGIAFVLRSPPEVVGVSTPPNVKAAIIIPAASVLLLIFGVWHGRNR